MEEKIRVKQRLGKYRIERRLAETEFATVYEAHDTVTGLPVALKIPHRHLMESEALEQFRKEVRLTANLDHPNILPIKDATFIDGWFVVAYPLGECSLEERLSRRMSLKTIVTFADQMLEAVAFAHSRHIMHCDIKPDNFILFPGNRLRLGDFGLAKVARRTLAASGSGTVGYCAPEQAMGKPSFRSDVFSLGLVLYRMLTGCLPEWPYRWPPPGFDRLRRRVHPKVIAFLKRALEVDERKRFPNAVRMYAAYKRLRPLILRTAALARRKRRRKRSTPPTWKNVRNREFLRNYRTLLEVHLTCRKCGGPVSEPMITCPWCGADRRVHNGPTRFTDRCPRCRRGIKADWRYCPWCYGGQVHPGARMRYNDSRYTATCTNPRCPDKRLMPFMRYCPWCRRKVTRRWTISGAKRRCSRCGWSVLPEYWQYCPWCGKSLSRR